MEFISWANTSRSVFGAVDTIALIVALSLCQVSLAAPHPRLVNLGSTQLVGEYRGSLIYSVTESFAERDLTGDGDLDDTSFVVHDLASGDVRSLGFVGLEVRIVDRWVVASISESRNTPLRDLNGDGDFDDRIVQAQDLESGETRNLGLPVRSVFSSDHGFGFALEESAVGRDLNGDGDRTDAVFHLHDLDTGETRNLGLARKGLLGFLIFAEPWVLLSVGEPEQGEDLDGDGDRFDSVLHIHDLRSGETRNAGVATRQIYPRDVSEGRVVYRSGDGGAYVLDLETGESRDLELVVCCMGLVGNWLLLQVEERDGDLNGDGDRDDLVVHLHDIRSGTTRNLGVVGTALLENDHLVLGVDESAQGADLNGDGDTADHVVHVHDLDTGETTNLMFAVASLPAPAADWSVFAVDESAQGEDFNGDGDALDSVIHAFEFASGEIRNLRLAVVLEGGTLSVTGNWLDLDVSEHDQGVDLNADGDESDRVAHVHDLAAGRTVNLGVVAASSRFGGRGVVGEDCFLLVADEDQGIDLNGDGDTLDPVVHIVDIASGTVTNLGVAAETSGQGPFAFTYADRLFIRVEESAQGEDLDADGRFFSDVLHVLDVNALKAPIEFLRGDCDGSGKVGGSPAEALVLLEWAFRGGIEPPCLAACDVNLDGRLAGPTDAIVILAYAFLGGPPPPAPFPDCGPTTLESDLAVGCANPGCP